MINNTRCMLTVITCILMLVTITSAAVTGDPSADGWSFGGNSLQNGVYTRGAMVYGFDVYSAALTVAAGSSLEISDGDYSWLAGDTVLGLGGKVNIAITAAQAGWTEFSDDVSFPVSSDTKLIAKFGVASATAFASTIAPGNGNGASSLSGGDFGVGAIQLRTTSDPTTTNYWSPYEGTLQRLASSTYISRYVDTNVSYLAGRLIWQYDNNLVTSWEFLLNTSLVARLDPAGTVPTAGSLGVMAVQHDNDDYTDALLIVPEPATMALLALGSLCLRRNQRA